VLLKRRAGVRRLPERRQSVNLDFRPMVTALSNLEGYEQEEIAAKDRVEGLRSFDLYQDQDHGKDPVGDHFT
jgi:hypothetical protein